MPQIYFLSFCVSKPSKLVPRERINTTIILQHGRRSRPVSENHKTAKEAFYCPKMAAADSSRKVGLADERDKRKNDRMPSVSTFLFPKVNYNIEAHVAHY